MTTFKVWASETILYEEKWIEAETYEEAEEQYQALFGTVEAPEEVDSNNFNIEVEEDE